jgi:hypothetical protein
MSRRQFRAAVVLYRTLASDAQRHAFYALHKRVYQLLESPGPRRGFWTDRRRAAKLEQLRLREPIADMLPLPFEGKPPHFMARPGGAE